MKASLVVTALLAVAIAVPAISDSIYGHNVVLTAVPVITFPHDPNPYGWDGPEGIATSPRGNLYAAMNIGGELFRVTPDGHSSVLARFVQNVDDAYLLGLAVDADESVYVAVWGWNDLTVNGVWRVDPDGQREFVMPIPAAYAGASVPNALAFDEEGNLYATDSPAGSIWRLGRDGDVSMWVQDDLLLGDFFGANGIAYRNSSLWILNYDRGRIVRIPIERDGSPGQPTTFVESPVLVGCDGGQFDVAGNMYVGVYGQGYLARVSARGEVSILMTADQLAPFNSPINPVFGFGRDRATIFISGTNPDVAKVTLRVPGMLLPQFKRPHHHCRR